MPLCQNEPHCDKMYMKKVCRKRISKTYIMTSMSMPTQEKVCYNVKKCIITSKSTS